MPFIICMYPFTIALYSVILNGIITDINFSTIYYNY